MASSNGLEVYPQLRFSEFKEPYKKTKLSSISNKVQRKDAQSEAPIMMLSAASGFIMQSDKYSRDNAGQSLKKYTLLKKGELAYNHGASKYKPYGCCFELTVDEARIPYVYHCFSLHNSCIPYVARLLNNQKIDQQLKKLISSSVRMDGLLNIAYEDYTGIDLFLPSLPEQEKIADFLSLVDERIEKQRQLVEALKKYKRGLLLKVFADKKANELLINLISIGKAGGTPLSSKSEYYNGDIPFLSISDMTSQGKYIKNTEKKITNLGLQSSSAWLVPDKSLIISMYASYGLVAINLVPLATSQAMYCIVPKNEADTEYLYYYLSFLAQTGYYERMVSTGTQPNLNAEKIKNIPVYNTDESSKSTIVKTFQLFDTRLKMETQKLEDLIKLKTSLLQQMFI